MEHEVGIQFKLQRHTELAIARYESIVNNFAERFEANSANYMIVLPLKAKISKFAWVIESISHEYLHLIITELESEDASIKLDNLGYNMATGCFDKRDY